MAILPVQSVEYIIKLPSPSNLDVLHGVGFSRHLVYDFVRHGIVVIFVAI